MKLFVLSQLTTWCIRYVTEAWELSSLAHKLENIFNHLQENLNKLHQIIRESYPKNKTEYMACPVYVFVAN